MIAFIGSVFSPYYAWARARRGVRPDDAHGRAGAAPRDGISAIDAENFCAFNVAFYGRGGKRWAMTERGRSRLERSRETIAIGPSRMTWDGSALRIDFDEWTMPWPSRLRGQVIVEPAALHHDVHSLAAEGGHVWQPVAPCARARVSLETPQSRWSGRAYVDTNAGDAPLERDFVGWHWSRGALPDGGAAIVYDADRRNGRHSLFALRFGPDGREAPFDPGPASMLPPTGWRVPRTAHAGEAEVVRTLEDTPFYARTVLRSRLLGEPHLAMHESLSLDRFASAWVQCLLPFRMPRRG